MRFPHKLAALGIAAVLSCSLAAPAFAYDPPMKDYADKLYLTGLFSGYGPDKYGFPTYGLDDPSTRAQAMVVLVHAMGKDEEAKQSPAAPFTDVPAWAAPAVNYAYQHRMTSGISSTLFGANDPITARQYMTFCLRILGYHNGDFSYADPNTLAEKLCVITQGDYAYDDEVFTRGDMVDLTYHTLLACTKGSSRSMADQQGIVFPERLFLKPIPPRQESHGWTKPANPGEVPLPSINPVVDACAVGLDYTHPANRPLVDENREHVFDIYGLQKAGVIADVPEFYYRSDLTMRENVERLAESLHAVDKGLQYWEPESSLASGGEITLIGNDHDHSTVIGAGQSAYRLTDPEYSPYGFGYSRRNLVLNSMAYFDRDMARRIDCLLHNYYNDPNSVTSRFSEAQLEAVGLKMVNYDNLGMPDRFSAQLSNGTYVWRVSVDSFNFGGNGSLDFSSVTVSVDMEPVGQP